MTHAFLLGFEVETTLAEVINPAHYEHGWHATLHPRHARGGRGGGAAARARRRPDAHRAGRRRVAGLGPQGKLRHHDQAVSRRPCGAERRALRRSSRARAGRPRPRPSRGRRATCACSAWGQDAAGAARHARRAVEDPGHRRGGEALPLLRLHPLDHRRRARAGSRAAHPARGVAEVIVGVTRPCPGSSSTRVRAPGLEAKFSAEFAAAAALGDRRVGIATFPTRRCRSRRSALHVRVRVVVDPEFRPMPSGGCGPASPCGSAMAGAELPTARGAGHPSHPLTPEALREKFDECARMVLPEDRVESVRQMVERLAPAPTSAASPRSSARRG